MKSIVYLKKKMVLLCLVLGVILGLGACADQGKKAESAAESSEASEEESAAPESEAESAEKESAAPESEAPQEESAAPESEAPQEESAAPESGAEPAEEESAAPEPEGPQEAAIFVLEPEKTADIEMGTEGTTWQVRYEYAWDDYGTVDFKLCVNDMEEAFMPDSFGYSVIQKAYVCDIDESDSYVNVLVDASGDNDIHTTCIFGFNESEICLISECDGSFIADTFAGGGIVTVESRTGMFLRDYGAFVLREEISVHDKSAEAVNVYSGCQVYSDDWEESFFQREFPVTLDKDLTVYEDADRTTEAGVIPGGSTVDCSFAGYADYMFVLQVSSGEMSGYILADMLAETCDGIYFAG